MALMFNDFRDIIFLGFQIWCEKTSLAQDGLHGLKKVGELKGNFLKCGVSENFSLIIIPSCCEREFSLSTKF